MKIMKDARIEVDRATAKMIAETICGEIEQSLKDNKEIYDLAERCEDQYSQVTKWMKAGRICDKPFEGAADYFVPLTEWIIDAVASRVSGTLFATEPYMTASGVEGSDAQKASGVTDFVDMITREVIYLRDNYEFFIKQTAKLPFATMKYEWFQDFDNVVTMESAFVFVNEEGDRQHILPDSEASEQADLVLKGYIPTDEKEDVWVSNEIELCNGPQLRYVRFRDYVWSPFAKRDSRLYWEGDRVWFTVNDMKLKKKQKKFIAESVDSIVSKIDYKDKQGSDKAIAMRAEKRESFYWCGRLPFNSDNKPDFNSPDAMEQEVICLVDYKDKELLQIKFWDHKRIPYPDRLYIRGEFERTENFEGRSLAQKLYMSQKELNSFHNTIMNNAMLAMMKVFKKRRTLQGDDWDKPQIYPGAILEVDMMDDIMPLEIGDVKGIAWELEQSFIDFAERISNISIYQTGTARKKGGSKTKGEVDMTIAEGNIGLDRFVRNHHGYLRKICKWTVGYYNERMPEGLERKIMGEDGQPVFPTYETERIYQEKGISPYWRAEDLEGKFDFKWNNTTLNSSKEWRLAVANDMMDRFLPHPMIAGNLLATWEILKQGIEARGEKEWRKYLPPKEAIVQEMQLMSQKAQMQKQGPQMNELVKRKLIERNAPAGLLEQL